MTAPAPDVPTAPPSPGATGPGRLTSLDAFRGAIMLLMASSGLGIPQMAKQHPDSPVWAFLGRQCEHAEWAGCTLWDIIQPAFMFMVGVALPWSLANRQARGESDAGQGRHAFGRALVLVLLAVFLTSAWSRSTEWVFTNVLAQIGLGYPFLFLAARTAPRTQMWITAALLTGYWLLFALHPVAAPDLDWAALGVPASWPHLQGLAAHWDKNWNAAATFDRWFLNLFPREAPFTHSSGGYQTLNAIPSLATMLLGAAAGRLLLAPHPLSQKVRRLALAGIAGMALGGLLAWTGLCPMVKRIWTPSWTLYSGGVVALLLAGFVQVVDRWNLRRAAWPLVVAGLNPIALYVMWQLSGGFVRNNLRIHFGQDLFERFGAPWSPVVERVLVLFVFWLVLAWMARRRLFIRV